MTLVLLRIWALRMRERRSPSGSFMDIVRASLPARLQQSGDQPLGAKLPQRDARQFMLAVKAARSARQLAAIANARGRGVARQFGELERSGKALLDGFSLIASDRFELRAPAGIFLSHAAAPIVLFD